MTDQELAERFERIENQLRRFDKMVNDLCAFAREHPMGKMLLNMLGL